MKLDKVIEEFFEKVFFKWGNVIVNHTAKVLIVTMVLIVALTAGIYF